MTDTAKAETYRKAAEEGDLEAQFSLASAYANGRGVPQDDAQAMLWYRKAADKGHTAAQNNIGWMHDNGRGVAKDPDEAIRWYRKAANNGNAFAQNNLGIKYENGTGVQKDLVEAARWFRLAAAQEHAQAKESLVRVEALIGPQKKKGNTPPPQRNVAPPPLVERREKEPDPANQGHEHRECKHLLDACTPLVYQHNAFRISGVFVDSSLRDIKKRIEDLKNAAELGNAEDEHNHAFALKPTPSIDHIRDAAQKLQDPERRIVDEFFWFWPSEWGAGKRDPALTALANGDRDTAFKLWSQTIAIDHSMAAVVAKHNLAVLYHLVALDSELVAAESELGEEQLATVDKYWKTSFQWWEELTDDETFWSLVSDRIRMLDDPRLTTGFARRMRQTFPDAMDKINAEVAIKFIEREKHALAEKHIAYMVSTHAGQDNVQKTMALVAKPLFARIRATLSHAEHVTSSDGAHADVAALNLLGIAKPSLLMLSRFLPKDSTELADVREATVDCCVQCVNAYLRRTQLTKEKWTVAIGILDKAKEIAISKHSCSEISELRASTVLGQHLENPRIRKIQSLISRTAGEELRAKLKTFGTEVAQELYELGCELGTQPEPYEIATDMVARSLRGLSIDLINSGQERVSRFLEFIGDEQNRARHQLGLQMNLPNALQLERNKWDSVIDLSVGVDLYDQGRKLARSPELKKRFTDDEEALNGTRKFCSKIQDLNSKRRERDLIFNWRSKRGVQPPAVTRQGSTGNTTSSSSGCFVASAVYGSYEHPAVIVLRRYRDECLACHIAGRSFIWGYYRVGPLLATLVARCNYLKRPCRQILDGAVVLIVRRFSAKDADQSKG